MQAILIISASQNEINTATATNMLRRTRERFEAMSTGSIEWWKFAFEVGGLIVLLLTFFFGGGAWLAGNILNKRQDEQLSKFAKDLADSKIEQGKQQERAARAERALKEVDNVAGAANEAAGRANERAAKLELEAAKQRERAALADERAATAERSLLELQDA